MSCTVQVKSRNSVTQKKVSNVIHRTTSETIRLGEPETINNNSSRQVMTALAISPPPLKQSACSFQITGVSLTQRTDFVGDDSADDLDESHTDDISRVTDNETPSFSEDTCSRDADESYIGSCSAVCSVTAVSTYSQYGLAIVPSETLAVNCLVYRNNNNSSSSAVSNVATPSTLSSREEELDMSYPKSPGVTPSTTTTSVTMVTTTTAATNKRFPGTRFHVVNVETPEPFRRGRWWCTDYLDDSKYTPKNALTYKSPDSPEISGTQPQPQYTMTATTKQTDGTKGVLNVGTKFNVYPVPTQSSTLSERSLQNVVAHSQPYSMTVVTQQQNLINAAQTFIRQNSMPETSKTQMHIQNYIQNQYIQALPIGIAGVPVNNTITTNSNAIVSSVAYQPLPVQQQAYGCSVLKPQSSSVGHVPASNVFIPTTITNANYVQPVYSQYSGKSAPLPMTNMVQQTSSPPQAWPTTPQGQNMLPPSAYQTTQVPVPSMGVSVKKKDYDDLHCCTKISGIRKTVLEPVVEDAFMDRSQMSTPAWTPASIVEAVATTLLFPPVKDITTEPKYKPYTEVSTKIRAFRKSSTF